MATSVPAEEEEVIGSARIGLWIHRKSDRGVAMKAAAMAGPLRLDRKDRQILKALQDDARQSLTALGKAIGLSQPAISERVRKLEASGVIAGYGARLDPVAVGLPIEAIVRVRTSHEHIRSYETLFRSMPEVMQVFRVTGDDCFVVHCALARPQALEGIVDRLAAHGSVTTSLVLSRPVDRAPPVPTD